MALSPKQLAALKTYLRAFLASQLAMLAIQLQNGAVDLRAFFAGAVTALIAPIVKWLDSSETSFGRGSE